MPTPTTPTGPGQNGEQVTEAKDVEFTAGEIKYFTSWFKNMLAKPDVDYEAVAREMNLKDARCASDRGRNIFKRHGFGVGQSGATPTKRTKATSSSEGLAVQDSAAKVSKPKTTRKRAPRAKKGETKQETPGPPVKDEDED